MTADSIFQEDAGVLIDRSAHYTAFREGSRPTHALAGVHPETLRDLALPRSAA
jgi:hypothetical protein